MALVIVAVVAVAAVAGALYFVSQQKGGGDESGMASVRSDVKMAIASDRTDAPGGHTLNITLTVINGLEMDFPHDDYEWDIFMTPRAEYDEGSYSASGSWTDLAQNVSSWVVPAGESDTLEGEWPLDRHTLEDGVSEYYLIFSLDDVIERENGHPARSIVVNAEKLEITVTG